MKLLPFFCACLFLAVSACMGRAGDGLPDADLPQPFDASMARSLLENPPFTRSLNLADSLTLTGIAYVEGKPVVTLLNRATKESFIVSEEPNALGWKLAGASPDSELRHTQVKIMVGPEIVTVRYGSEQLAPDHAKQSPGPQGGPPLVSFSSGGGNHFRAFSYLGENGRDRYHSLSDKTREKFNDTMQKIIEKHPEMTKEQRSDYAEKVFSKYQTEDQKQPAGEAVEKVPKAPKLAKSGRVK